MVEASLAQTPCVQRHRHEEPVREHVRIPVRRSKVWGSLGRERRGPGDPWIAQGVEELAGKRQPEVYTAGVFETVDGFAERTAGVPNRDGTLESERLVGTVRASKPMRDSAGERLAANFAGGRRDRFEKILAGWAEVGAARRRQAHNAGRAARRV